MNSWVDTIRVSKIKSTNPSYIINFTINGVRYEYFTENLEQIEAQINKIQENKTLKTKIIM